MKNANRDIVKNEELKGYNKELLCRLPKEKSEEKKSLMPQKRKRKKKKMFQLPHLPPENYPRIKVTKSSSQTPRKRKKII